MMNFSSVVKIVTLACKILFYKFQLLLKQLILSEQLGDFCLQSLFLSVKFTDRLQCTLQKLCFRVKRCNVQSQTTYRVQQNSNAINKAKRIVIVISPVLCILHTKTAATDETEIHKPVNHRLVKQIQVSDSPYLTSSTLTASRLQLALKLCILICQRIYGILKINNI